MRTISTLLLAVSLFSFGTGCACPFQPAGPSAGDKIASAKSLDASFIAAFNKADVDGVAALYWNSPELTVYPPGEMESRGWQAAHDSFVHVFKEMPGAQLQLVDPQYRVAGDYVIGNGRWKMTFPAGAEMLGRYTEASASKEGKWVYVLDHASAPLPPMPAAGTQLGK